MRKLPFDLVLPRGKDVCILTNDAYLKEYMMRSNSNRSTVTCFRCNEQGHYKSECHFWKTRYCLSPTVCKKESINCVYAHHPSEIRDGSNRP